MRELCNFGGLSVQIALLETRLGIIALQFCWQIVMEISCLTCCSGSQIMQQAYNVSQQKIGAEPRVGDTLSYVHGICT